MWSKPGLAKFQSSTIGVNRHSFGGKDTHQASVVFISYLFRRVSRVAQDRLSRCRTGTRAASAATAPRIFRGSYSDETAIANSRTRAAAPDRSPMGAGRK